MRPLPRPSYHLDYSTDQPRGDAGAGGRMSQWNYARTWETIAGVAPERVTIVTDDGRRLTFRELDERATRLAHVFARAGIGRGDVVGIALTNRPEYIETFFAALKLGAVPANINYQYRAE